MVHDAIVQKGKEYPGELNEFEAGASKFLDAAHAHAKSDLSDAKLAQTKKDQDEFFGHVRHGLKVGLKQERENSAAFFKGYGVAYDAGLKAWQEKKGAFRSPVNALADSVET